MRTLSLRLPDRLDDRLRRESKSSRRKRSDLVREAVDQYLDDLERRRLEEAMVRAASALENDPEIPTVAEEFAASEEEALKGAEGGER